MYKINLLIINLLVFIPIGLTAETYEVGAWFNILPKNSNLHTAKKIAKKKKLRANLGDQITILKDTGYEFEDNGYVYFELTKKGDSSSSGIYFADRSSIESYIRKKSLTPVSKARTTTTSIPKQKEVGPPKSLYGDDDEDEDDIVTNEPIDSKKDVGPPETLYGDDDDIKEVSEESGIIKPRPLVEAVELAQQSLSDDAGPVEPRVERVQACDVGDPKSKPKKQDSKSLQYESCDKENNYLEKLLAKNVSKKDLSASDDTKSCIRTGLLSGGTRGIKYPYCPKDKSKSDGEKNTIKPCISNNYVSFVKKVLEDTTACFENLSTEDLLPLVAAESRFNLNISNSVKASGLFQVTAPLLNDGTRMKKVASKNTANCKKLKEFVFDGTVSGNMNTCERTALPEGVKRTTYFAIAALSNAKVKADNLLNQFGKNKLKALDIEGIKQDLMAMMHNRGVNGVRKVFDKFMIKFTEASKSVKKSKNRTGLEKMWNEVDKDKKFSRDTFIKYFSSFMYYEKHGSKNEEKIKNLIKLKKEYDSKYKKQLSDLLSKTKSKDKKIRKEAKSELNKLTKKLSKEVVKNSPKSARSAVVGKSFTFDKFFNKLPMVVHRMREYEGSSFALSMSCIQDKMERDAKDKFGLNVTCGPAKISKDRERQIQKSGIPPRCGHDELAKNFKETLGADYAHVE